MKSQADLITKTNQINRQSVTISNIDLYHYILDPQPQFVSQKSKKTSLWLWSWSILIQISLTDHESWVLPTAAAFEAVHSLCGKKKKQLFLLISLDSLVMAHSLLFVIESMRLPLSPSLRRLFYTDRTFFEDMSRQFSMEMEVENQLVKELELNGSGHHHLPLEERQRRHAMELLCFLGPRSPPAPQLCGPFESDTDSETVTKRRRKFKPNYTPKTVTFSHVVMVYTQEHLQIFEFRFIWRQWFF